MTLVQHYCECESPRLLGDEHCHRCGYDMSPPDAIRPDTVLLSHKIAEHLMGKGSRRGMFRHGTFREVRE